MPVNYLNATARRDLAAAGPYWPAVPVGGDHAQRHRLGYQPQYRRMWISVGMRRDVDFGDLIDYLLRDSNTRAILMYMENTRTGASLSPLPAPPRVKPVIVLKPRDFKAGPVEDAVYDAVFQRAGILRVNNIEQLFGAAETRYRYQAGVQQSPDGAEQQLQSGLADQ